MYTSRKRHLRKKRVFLSKQKTFALFNASNLKTSQINKIKLSLHNARLYFMPLYLNPPKLALGYPIVIVIYDNINDLKTNMPKIIKKIDCLGISINKKWYPADIFKKNLNNLNYKILSLLIKKNYIK